MNNHLILEDDDLSAGLIIKFPAYFKRRLKARVQPPTVRSVNSSDSGMQAALVVSTVAPPVHHAMLVRDVLELGRGDHPPQDIWLPLNILPA